MRKNENLKRFLTDTYLKSDVSPKFAILIKGKWGCGKTYFIADLLEKHYGKDYRKDDVIWVSLYGLSDINQVQRKIYETCHPILTNRMTKLAFNFAKSALKFSSGVDFNGDKNNDLSIDLSLPEIESEEKKISSKKLIVIDDLERCSIPPEQILGYFSEYILEKNLKAIFIGNTEEILTNDNNEIKNNFEKTKEKVIGFEFLIEPEFENAVSKFCEELKLQDSESNIKDICLYVCEKLKFQNLRVVRQSLYYLAQLFNFFSVVEINEHKEYFNSMMKIFFALFFQKSTGDLTKDNISKSIYIFNNRELAYKEWEFCENKGEYDSFRLQAIPLEDLYSDIILNGIIDKDSIRKNFIDWIAPPENQPAYIRIQQELYRMDDKTFKELYRKAQLEFKNNELHTYNEILSYLSMELKLKDEGIIQTDLKKIKCKIQQYIKKNKNSIHSELIYDFRGDTSFNNKESENFYKEIVIFLKQEKDDFTVLNIKKRILNLVSQLPHSYMELCKDITCADSDINKDYPILSYVPLRKFYDLIKKMNYREQLFIFKSFEQRYEKYYSNGKLRESHYPDIDCIKQLIYFYKSDLRNTKLSPLNVQRKHLINFYSELYEWMVRQKDENEKK